MPASRRRRAFGQHFLKDPRIISQIIDLTFAETERVKARTLLEVGPGTGALTRPLLDGLSAIETLQKFWIIEKDRKLATFWMEQASDRPEVEVISNDFLEVPAESYLSAPPMVVVSNLPYSSGTTIMSALALNPAKISAMILMFQAEVAHRLRAVPGEKAWGSLSLWIQNQWDVTKVVSVPPGAFQPPPEVNSEVVLLRPRVDPRIPETDGKEEAFDQLLRVAFAHRRKMLRSGLPKGSLHLNALAKTSIDGTRRAESLNWDEWREWFRAVISS